MKKIISLLLTFCIVLSLVPSVIASASQTSSVDEEVVNRVFGLGLIPHATRADYQPDAPLTRGELAWVLDNIYYYETNTLKSEFTWQFYGNSSLDNDHLKNPPPADNARFADVPSTYWAYSIIENIVSLGLMNGTSSDKFSPESNVKLEQLIKCIVVLLGYETQAEYYGGYPAGYNKVANDLDLLDGVSAPDGIVTNAVLIQVLDNCLEVKLMEFNGVVSDKNGSYIAYVKSNDNFLTGILGLDVAEGVMKDNSVTALLGESKVKENEFVVGNVLLKANADIAPSLYGYIGREVECYYIANENTKKRDLIVYAGVTGLDTAVEIEPENFIGYNNGAIHYYEGDKARKIALTDLFALIYNGKALSTYNESVFDVTDGKITVIKENGSENDVIVIEDYETWYVSGVDPDNGRIHNMLADMDGMHTLEFDDDSYVTIIKADGTPGTIADITEGAIIDVAANGDVITIRISDRVQAGVIDAISKEGGKTTLIVGEDEFEIADAFYDYKDRIDFKIGDEVTLYFNNFGKVAWMIYGSETAYRAGMVMDADTEFENMMLKALFLIFDGTDKVAVPYQMADKVTVSNSLGKEVLYKDAEKLITDHGAYRGLVRYKLNADKEINYIEFPITDVRNQLEDKLTFIAETTTEETFRFNNFGGKAITDANTVVFCVDPDNRDDEKGYDVVKVSGTFSNEGEYATKIYTTKRKSKLAEFILYETKSKTSSLAFTKEGVNAIVVQRYTEVYDDDEGSVMGIKGFIFNTLSTKGENKMGTIKILKDVKVTTVMGHEFNGTIEPGDILLFGTDADGYVNELRIVWDENGVNPEYPQGAPGALTDSKGYYGDTNSTDFSGTNYKGPLDQMPNPYCLQTSSGVTNVKKATSFYCGPVSVHYGFIARNNYGAIEITSQDLSVEEYDEYGLDGRHLIRTWTTPTNIMSITLSGKDNVQILWGGTATLNPIRTFDAYKHNCSRVITFSSYAQMGRMIVINGYFEE